MGGRHSYLGFLRSPGCGNPLPPSYPFKGPQSRAAIQPSVVQGPLSQGLFSGDSGSDCVLMPPSLPSLVEKSLSFPCPPPVTPLVPGQVCSCRRCEGTLAVMLICKSKMNTSFQDSQSHGDASQAFRESFAEDPP